MNHPRRRNAALTGLMGAAMLLAACGSGVTNQPIEEAAPGQLGATTGGDAVAPAPVEGGKRYLFRRDKPPVEVQETSRQAINGLPDLDGLEYVPLLSTPETVAVYMLEEAPGKPWNSLINQAQLRLFEDFASDRGMGDWLILVTDVVVLGSADPIPPNAYRWNRSEVEELASCGIPANGGNDCTASFLDSADHIVLAPPQGPPRGR